MPATAHTDILRRKIEGASARAARAALCDTMLDGLVTAMTKVFLQETRLEITVRIADSRVGRTADILGRMQAALFGILGLADSRGLAGWDAGLLELMTATLSGGTPPDPVPDPVSDPAADATGAATPPDATDSPDNAPRRFSHTDARLAAHMTDLFLAEAFGDTPCFAHRKSGWICQSERDKAPLPFLLSESHYACIVLVLGQQAGGDFGRFELCLPLPCLQPHDRTGDGDAADWRAHMQAETLRAPVEMTAILHRQSMALEQLLALEPGAELPLAGARLDRIALEAPGTGPAPLFQGRLGAIDGGKAFRVTRIPHRETAGTPATPVLPDPAQTAPHQPQPTPLPENATLSPVPASNGTLPSAQGP